MILWLATFIRQYRMQRDKAHGMGRAGRVQAAYFAACGAWVASKWGPNPAALLVQFASFRSAGE